MEGIVVITKGILETSKLVVKKIKNKYFVNFLTNLILR